MVTDIHIIYTPLGSYIIGNIPPQLQADEQARQRPRKEARETAEILSLRAGAGPGGAGTARKGGLKVW